MHIIYNLYKYLKTQSYIIILLSIDKLNLETSFLNINHILIANLIFSYFLTIITLDYELYLKNSRIEYLILKKIKI